MFCAFRCSAWTVLIVASLVLAACDPSGGEQPAPPASSAASSPHAADAEAGRVDAYTVRGQVVAMPVAGRRQIQVAHEAIPDFKNKAGEVVGMATMTMPFPVDESVSLEGIEEADAVELTFEVDWRSVGYRVTSITKLAEGTELALEAAGHEMGEDHAGHDHADHMGHDHGDHAGHNH